MERSIAPPPRRSARVAGARSRGARPTSPPSVAAVVWSDQLGGRGTELLLLLLPYLTGIERMRAGCVCREWRDAAKRPEVWRAVHIEVRDAPLQRIRSWSTPQQERLDAQRAEYERARDAHALNAVFERAGPHVREVSLWHPSRGSREDVGLVGAIVHSGCHNIERLDDLVLDHHISVPVAARLVECCPRIASATGLTLRISDDDDAATAASATRGLPGASIIADPVGDSGAAVVAAALKAGRVRDLDVYLDGQNWEAATPAGSARIARALVGNTSVINVFFWGQELGSQAASDFGAFVRHSATLKELSFGRYCDVTDDEVALIAAGLKENKSVERLSFSWAQFGPAGASAIADVLRTSASLTCISLEFCENVGDAGALALAAAMTSNSTLTELNLKGAGVRDEGVCALAAAAEARSCRFELVLDDYDRRVSNRAKAALRRAELANPGLEVYGIRNLEEQDDEDSLSDEEAAEEEEAAAEEEEEEEEDGPGV